MTGVIAALVEAWDEVRVHKVRVVLSLVGVMLAVLATTIITAAGDLARQINKEEIERSGGRPATLGVNVWSEQEQIPPGELSTAFDDVVRRYEVRYASQSRYVEQVYRFSTGSQVVQTRIVDQPYGDIHRLVPLLGHWFSAADEQRYAPAVVVNEAFHGALGAPDMRTHPTVVLGGERPVRVVVLGVLADEYPNVEPSAFMLRSAAERWTEAGGDLFGPATLELWVPPDQADALQAAVPRDLQASLGAGTTADVVRQDSDSFAGIDAKLTWGIRGVSAIALALGSLGLVNIGLVTVRYRIREIGIRRSFGATSARVFFSVLMESVCATIVAGLVGVGIAVAIVTNLPASAFGIGAATEIPPFPVRAAVEGMVAACLVGALAGLVPAIIAVRVKVIDAIRY